jgi:hypothetical protein
MSGTFQPSSSTGTSARAVAVVALSDPEFEESPDTGLSRTAIREREPQSEPAPVLPLHRKKNGTASERREEEAALVEPEPPRASAPDRDTSLPHVPIPPGPPILASDLLREQMRPSSPGGNALRRTTVALTAVGALGVLLAGGVHPLTFVALAVLITMAILALTPMSYRGRAVALFFVGSIATGVALWQQTLQGVASEATILAGATILLSGSLLFRAYYRGARLARVAVTFGVLALGAWFFVSGGHESLVTLEGDWQSWAPATTHMTFGLLALLSLMAFMDNSTRGGSHVWAVALHPGAHNRRHPCRRSGNDRRGDGTRAGSRRRVPGELQPDPRARLSRALSSGHLARPRGQQDDRTGAPLLVLGLAEAGVGEPRVGHGHPVARAVFDRVERLAHRGRTRHGLPDDTRFDTTLEQTGFGIAIGVELVAELPGVADHARVGRRLLAQ